MLFKNKAKITFTKHPKITKEFMGKTQSTEASPAHHSGKGTRARLNTAANKMFFT